MTSCAYCGSDVERHDPVVVYEGTGEEGTPAGRFCNYACLRQHIDEEDLVSGACCEIDLSS